MLFERWDEMAREHRDKLALRDLARGQSWTFAQLASAAEKSIGPDEPVFFPEGISADFVFAVLRAWRSDRVICPLESGQAVPEIAGLCLPAPSTSRLLRAPLAHR